MIREGVIGPNSVVSNDLFSYVQDDKFHGKVSNFDEEEKIFFLHLGRFDEHFESLNQELKFAFKRNFSSAKTDFLLFFSDIYSSKRSESFRVEKLEEKLFCVVKFGKNYRRVLIEKVGTKSVRLNFLDFGRRQEVESKNLIFKKLFKRFAEMPRMVIAARLFELDFIEQNDLRQKILQILDRQKILIERKQTIDGIFQIEIFDEEKVSLSEKLIENRLAVSRTLVLTPLERASVCPLSDDDQNWDEEETAVVNEAPFKLIQFDQNFSFHIVRNNEQRVFIKSTDLAVLFHVPEIEILAEKVRFE